MLNLEWSTALSPGDRQQLIKAHQYPQPRLDVLPWLWDFHPQRITGMDSSDGLADALEQLCRASGVGARIHLNQIPTAHGLTAVLSEEKIRHWALYGGEDFELVLCLSPEVAHPFVEKLGEDAAIIGELLFGDRIELLDDLAPEDKQNPNFDLRSSWGFQHFN
jgi:thiamine-monophosphate kinase